MAVVGRRDNGGPGEGMGRGQVLGENKEQVRETARREVNKCRPLNGALRGRKESGRITSRVLLLFCLPMAGISLGKHPSSHSWSTATPPVLR